MDMFLLSKKLPKGSFSVSWRPGAESSRAACQPIFLKLPNKVCSAAYTLSYARVDRGLGYGV